MILELSNISGEPLQSQITSQIKAQILNGLLPAGYALPSIRSLAREQHVSVITTQRAYEALEREGLIVSMPGKGFFVTELKETERNELARANFLAKLEPIIATALKEGLNEKEIFELIGNRLNNKQV